ncbi:MAG: DUF4846 domain-containing protein [Saprospiraceae bacterium]
MTHIFILCIVQLLYPFCIDSFTKDIVEPHLTTTSLPGKDNTVLTRFSPPAGYIRPEHNSNTFAYYLNHLPLKEKGAFVNMHNGNMKANPGVYIGVVDLPIGTKNLHQCADAVIRLRAEYLWNQKRWDDIHFNFLSDSKPRFYKDYVHEDHSYEAFWHYLEYIFEYANTSSLADELLPVPSMRSMQIGDVLIEKKQPFGHAVIVIDMAVNNQGKKVYLLAQSYMPAQEIQVLTNPSNSTKSPWYELKEGGIVTPEWTFKQSHLKRFR